MRSRTRRVEKMLKPGRGACFFVVSLRLCNIPFVSIYVALAIIRADLVISGLKDG
jgi:hypothetical protein